MRYKGKKRNDMTMNNESGEKRKLISKFQNDIVARIFKAI